MSSFWQNYKQTILLLGGVLIGGLVGFLFPAATPYMKPVGDIFMNLLFILIVPLVFFSVSSSVANLSRNHMLGKMFSRSFSVWIVLLITGVLCTYLLTLVYPPTLSALHGVGESSEQYEAATRNIGDLIVNALTVSDFEQLFSTRHILPLMIVAVLIGWSAAKMDNDTIRGFFDKGNDLTGKALDMLMQVGPLGLGCYFGALTADMGNMLVVGYGRLLLIHCAIALLFFCLVFPLLMLVAKGGKGFREYWRAILPPSVTAISTLSSSASIPANVKACKQMGVQQDIAEAAVPLGTHMFKFGSGVCCTQKVIFVLLLSGQAIAEPSTAFLIIGMAILASMVVGAVPTGAGTAELLICSMVGADPKMVGLIMVLSTLVDMPATLLNVSGNFTATVLIDKLLKK